VQLIRLLVVAAAGVLAVIGYIQEGRRLEHIRQLSGHQARDFYEAGRARNERVMWLIAVAAVATAGVFVYQAMTLTPAAVPHP